MNARRYSIGPPSGNEMRRPSEKAAHPENKQKQQCPVTNTSLAPLKGRDVILHIAAARPSATAVRAAIALFAPWRPYD